MSAKSEGTPLDQDRVERLAAQLFAALLPELQKLPPHRDNPLTCFRAHR